MLVYEIAMTLSTSSTTRRLRLLPLLLVPPMTTGIITAAITITIANTIAVDYYYYCYSYPYYYYHYKARLLFLARNHMTTPFHIGSCREFNLFHVGVDTQHQTIS